MQCGMDGMLTVHAPHAMPSAPHHLLATYTQFYLHHNILNVLLDATSSGLHIVISKWSHDS